MRSILCVLLLMALSGVQALAAEFQSTTTPIPWQQVERKRTFWAFVEREQLSDLDRVSRMVFAVQTGRGGPKPSALTVHWQMKQGDKLVAENSAPMTKGLVDVRFSLAGLTPGRYDVTAELKQGQQVLETSKTFFRFAKATPPPQKGRIALTLPRGVPIGSGTYPITCGVPFPKGALWKTDNVRVVTASGKVVPVQTIARSRWGHSDATSIRWLGVDFQSAQAKGWWPKREETPYFLEYGPKVSSAKAPVAVKVEESDDGIRVNTGPLQFLVRRKGFNLLDDVRLNGQAIMDATAKDGLYLIDHKGSTYRAANDQATTLKIEEQGALRVVLRVEGWYVKDGSKGAKLSYTLPTDKLCKFITRIEAYAGKPYVRILNTWVLTHDTFTVRLRDVGMTLPVRECRQATFGVDKGAPISQAVGKDGVYLIQHLPGAFAVENGAGKLLQKGERSAGWVTAETAGGLVTVGHRETWQRFPKEFEVTPDSLRFHVWPAHGRKHPEIDPLKHDEIHKLWYAHEGTELNMVQPWSYYLKVAKIEGKPDTGVYKGPGLALAGIHASGMGAAITSDTMVQFAPKDKTAEAQQVAECFQATPHALPDPAWLCASKAIGYVQPYSPKQFKGAEKTVEDMVKGYWETQDKAGEYGMWVYRVWHHNQLVGKNKWQLYRLYNSTHHYEAFMPWLLYARSGDPFYLTQGQANIRQLSDVQTIHYDDPSYPHKEYHFRQGRLVGSTKHTNGFNTWGGDHAILGHLTCYNGMMLAHYLTGDLRLREVVVDEWQKTVLTDRANPEYARANRSGPSHYRRSGSRDVTNALGELIDLYQMTYRPEILALMAPAMDFFANQHMRVWGQPLQNVLLFHGNETVKKRVLDGVKEFRASNGKPKDKYTLWYTHARHAVFATASILDPKSKAHVDAWLQADVLGRGVKAMEVRTQTPNALPFCTVPDFVLYMPRVLYAVANAGGKNSLSQLALSQPMPIHSLKLKGWMRVIVKEEVDQPIDITFTGAVKQAFSMRVYGPDNTRILESTVPAGQHSGHVITLPKDEKVGEYVIFIKAYDNKAHLVAPLTKLPEVYQTEYWSQHSTTRYFVRSHTDKPETLTVTSRIAKMRAYTGDMKTLLASTDKGGTIKFDVGPDGAWLSLRTRYVHTKTGELTLAVSPERWFAPSKEKMALRP
jgi:PcRGLX-like protein central beta sandwich domain